MPSEIIESSEIIDSVDSLTAELDSMEASEVSPELVESLSRLHAAIFSVVTCREKGAAKEETEKYPLNPSLDWTREELLLRPTTIISTTANRANAAMDRAFIDNVHDIKKTFSTDTSPKSLVKYTVFIQMLRTRDSYVRFGKAHYDIIFNRLREQGFIDADGVWLI